MEPASLVARPWRLGLAWCAARRHHRDCSRRMWSELSQNVFGLHRRQTRAERLGAVRKMQAGDYDIGSREGKKEAFRRSVDRLGNCLIGCSATNLTVPLCWATGVILSRGTIWLLGERPQWGTEKRVSGLETNTFIKSLQ